MNLLKGKVALISGASGWLGSAIAKRFAIDGSIIYLAGRNMDKLEKIATDINEKSKNQIAFPVFMDVKNEISIQDAVDNIISEQGHIDILVNCAGGSAREKMANLIDQDISVIDDVISVNLRGTILCSKIVGNYMSKQNTGKIINISSIIGEHGKPKCSDYAASKAGILGFTKTIAQELGKYGITVNCISPGFIQRESFNDNQLPYLLNTNFLNRIGTAEDIVPAVLFLASENANFITGQNLCVDGGRSLGLHGD